jgi:hypothetical protein
MYSASSGCRRVSFDSVEVREYDVTIGDNVSTSALLQHLALLITTGYLGSWLLRSTSVALLAFRVSELTLNQTLSVPTCKAIV